MNLGKQVQQKANIRMDQNFMDTSKNSKMDNGSRTQKEDFLNIYELPSQMTQKSDNNVDNLNNIQNIHSIINTNQLLEKCDRATFELLNSIKLHSYEIISIYSNVPLEWFYSKLNEKFYSTG